MIETRSSPKLRSKLFIDFRIGNTSSDSKRRQEKLLLKSAKDLHAWISLTWPAAAAVISRVRVFSSPVRLGKFSSNFKV